MIVGMQVAPGKVILIFQEDLSNIDHNKFAFCVSKNLCFYLYLNSEPRRHIQDAQVPVLGQLEMPALDHTSYIDTAQLLEFSPQVADKAVRAGKVWSTPDSVIDRVVEAVKKSRYLSPLQKESILHSFDKLKT